MSVLSDIDRRIVQAAIRHARRPKINVLTERPVADATTKPPRVDKPAQVGTGRSASTFTGICVYCGTPTLHPIACVAHADLPNLDSHTTAVVTATTNGIRRTTIPGSTTDARQGESR